MNAPQNEEVFKKNLQNLHQIGKLFDMQRQLVTESFNIRKNIATALTMILSGARGETLDQFRDFLRMTSMTIDEIYQFHKEYD